MASRFRSGGGQLPGGPAETNFVHGRTGINLGPVSGRYAENMYDGGSEGEKGMTIQELDQLLDIGKQAMWTVNPEKKVTNVYKTIDEYFGEEEIERLSILMDGLIAIQNCNPILSIIAPYFHTDARTVSYKVWTLNTLPAQQTLNGVEERTNSWEQHEFHVTTRMFGHMLMFPIDILQTLQQNSLIITLSTMQLGLSLAETFVQIALVYFVSHGLINRYMKEGGYIWQDKHCDMDIIEAIDMRMHAAINCGIDYFMREFEIMRQTLSHNPARPNETYLLVPLAVAFALSTQPTAEQIRTYETYRGYVEESKGYKVGNIAEGSKQVTTVAPSTPAYRMQAGGDLVILTVPIIPISAHFQLPSVLNSYDSVPQYFYSPQRVKTSTDVYELKGSIGIYDLDRPDDLRFIKPSEFMANCGIWDSRTNGFSTAFQKSISELNDPYGASNKKKKPKKSKKGGKKRKGGSSDSDDDSDGDITDLDQSVACHTPSISDPDMLEEVRRLTQTPGQTIDLENYIDEMPFTWYDGDKMKTRSAKHIHSISEGTCPNADCVRAGEDIGKLDADAVGPMTDLLTNAQQLLDLPMNKETAKWLIDQNKPLFAKAGATTWYHKGKTTFGKCPRDAGTFMINKKPPEGVIIGAGMAHMLHLLPTLIRLGNKQSTEFLKPIEKAHKKFTQKLYTAKVLMQSELFHRVPAWVKDQKPGATAIIGNVLEGIPMFVWHEDVGVARNLTEQTFMDHESLTTALSNAKNVSGQEKEASEFDYRLYILKSLLDAKINPLERDGLLIVDYIIANNKFGPDSENEIVAFFKKPGKLNNPYGKVENLQNSCKMASALGLTLLCIKDGINDLNYDAFMSQVSRMDKKNLQSIKLNEETTLEDAAASTPTASEFYEKLAAFFVDAISSENDEAVSGHLIRTPIALSVSSMRQYYDSIKDQPMDKATTLFPGDWRTNYTTAVTNDLEDYLDSIPHASGHMFIPPGDVKSDEYGIRRQEKIRAKSQIDYGAGIGLEYASESEDEEEEEEEALKQKKKKKPGDKEGGAFGLFDAPHGHKRNFGGMDVSRSTALSGYLPSVSVARFEDLAMRYGASLNPTTLWLTLIYLFMKTDLKTMSKLADSGIWVPFDLVGMRNTINEVSSLPLVAGGCAQAIINRPYVQQVGNSMNNDWKMKASIQFGIAPLYTDTIVLLKGAFYVRNIYGLNTKFCKDPEKFKVTIGPDQHSTSEPCLFSMIVPTTYDLGDAFNWNGTSINPMTLNLGKIEGCTIGKRRCLVIDHFYANYYGMMKRLITQSHNTRMDVIKTFYTPDNTLAYMPDLDAQLRQLNYRCLMRNLITRGPHAVYDGPQLAIQTFSGRGAFGDIGIQSKGSGRVHRGRSVFFPSLADTLGHSLGIGQH